MHWHCDILGYGFAWQCWTIDLCNSRRTLARVVLLNRKTPFPWRSWGWFWTAEQGIGCLTYETFHEGKMTGWRLRGPVERF
jgi:hypothetical protein